MHMCRIADGFDNSPCICETRSFTALEVAEEAGQHNLGILQA